MSTDKLKVWIRRAPFDWVEQAPSAVKKRRMYASWEACQIALSELPPDGPDERWARRHQYAAVCTFVFLVGLVLIRLCYSVVI